MFLLLQLNCSVSPGHLLYAGDFWPHISSMALVITQHSLVSSGRLHLWGLVVSFRITLCLLCLSASTHLPRTLYWVCCYLYYWWHHSPFIQCSPRSYHLVSRMVLKARTWSEGNSFCMREMTCYIKEHLSFVPNIYCFLELGWVNCSKTLLHIMLHTFSSCSLLLFIYWLTGTALSCQQSGLCLWKALLLGRQWGYGTLRIWGTARVVNIHESLMKLHVALLTTKCLFTIFQMKHAIVFIKTWSSLKHAHTNLSACTSCACVICLQL